MVVLQVIFITVSFVMCFFCGLLNGIRWERRRAKRIQDKLKLDLINVSFGIAPMPGETVDQLSERVRSFIKDPFKHARENPAWIKK